jgi:hypothetical protein
LIYFIFRDDTYVVFSIFIYLMIIGGFAAGVRILLKKDRQDTIIRKIRKFQKNTIKLYFARRLRKPEGGGERSHRAGTHTGARAHTWPRRPVVWPPWSTSAIAPLRISSSLKT